MSRAESTRETWRDPEIRAARSRKKISEEARAFHSENTRKTWADPAIRAARCKAISDARRAGIDARKGVEVPAWAARAGLSGIYRDRAVEKDEFAAAALCRKILRARRA